MDSATRVGESGDSTDVARTRPGHAGLIRITSRLGVWGLIAALVPPMATELGGPMWLASLTPMVVAGLVASGIGTMAASVLVLRAAPAGSRPLKLAASAGVPFGFLLVLGGAMILAPLSRFANVVDAAGPVVLVLGVLIVVSLVIGFLLGGRDVRETLEP